MGTEIYHYTRQSNFEKINLSGFIELEGFTIQQEANNNPDATTPFDQDLTYSEFWLQLKKQFNITGRFVWFTEESSCSCISGLQDFEKVAIKFNSDDIRAKKWTDIVPILMHHSNKSRRMVEQLNQSAIQSGDDISKWWVCSERVDINIAIT